MRPTSPSPSQMRPSLAPGLTLYICRHGETEANVEKRFQGLTLDTPLTTEGCEQARTIAAILARQTPDPDQLAYVSSPLQRARRTMEIVRATLGLSVAGYFTDDRLVEIDLGAWDGLTDAQARALDPLIYDRRKADKWSIRVPSGESYADVAIRCESFIASLSADTFAVTHGAYTRVLRGLFEELTWQQMSKLDETQGVLFRVRGSSVERLES
jgi:broad specificity phosphatase PhoE